MQTLAIVVDERELSTIRAALLLFQEQVDALPEDLAEMLAACGRPLSGPEIESLSLRLEASANQAMDPSAEARTLIDHGLESERFYRETRSLGPT
jgi:hypothetical protein